MALTTSCMDRSRMADTVCLLTWPLTKSTNIDCVATWRMALYQQRVVLFTHPSTCVNCGSGEVCLYGSLEAGIDILYMQ